MKVMVERRIIVTDTIEIDDKYAANLRRTQELWYKGEMRWMVESMGWFCP